MKVIMFSLDRSLLGQKTSTGDTVKRHRLYGSFVQSLDIVVFSKKGHNKQVLSKNVSAHPTNSRSRFCYFSDAFKIAKQIYQERGADLVIGDIFTGFPAWLIKKKFGPKFLMHMHGDFLSNPKGLEGKASNFGLLCLSKFLCKKADAIRVVSSGIAGKLKKASMDQNKIHVISTPFDLSLFLNFDQARVFEINQNIPGKKILFVGRLEKVKNIEFLLEAFSQVLTQYKNTTLLVVGSGSQEKALQQKAKQLDLLSNVRFIGRVDYDDLSSYYHACDIFALPSLSESFGKILLEAGASGTPCVASKTTGAQEIVIDGKTGLLVPINNKKRFIEALNKLLSNQKLAQKMGENAKQHIKQNFDGDIMTEKIIALWRSLVQVR